MDSTKLLFTKQDKNVHYHYHFSPNKNALPNSSSPPPEKPLNHDNLPNNNIFK